MLNVNLNPTSMMSKQVIILLALLLLNNRAEAQYCEELDRTLFPMLPADIPQKINCRDSADLRQGWWLEYRIQHNTMDNSNGTSKNNYVESYTYGKYKDDIKIGDWVMVVSRPSPHIKRHDLYYYASDTFLIKSGFRENGWNESSIYYNSDSSIIKSTSLVAGDIFPICIECEKYKMKDDQCIMTYRNNKIKQFPLNQFEFEFYRSFCDFDKEKWLIDEVIRKKNLK